MREMGDGRFSDLLAEAGVAISIRRKEISTFWQNATMPLGGRSTRLKSRLSVTLHVARRNFGLNWEFTLVDDERPLSSPGESPDRGPRIIPFALKKQADHLEGHSAR